MKKYKKNIIIAVSLFILILAAFFIWFNFYNYKFSLDNNGYLVYKGTVSSITVPSEIKGQSVKLSDDSFKGNKYLKKALIEEGITEIRGFAECKKLKIVELPNSVYKLGDHAFYKDESIASINLDNVKEYERESLWAYRVKINTLMDKINSDTIVCGAIRGIKAKEIKIPECVKTIDDFAFEDVTTSKVIIPESVTSIGLQDGFNWTDGENYYVKEGSYAEQWMKDYRHNYHIY